MYHPELLPWRLLFVVSALFLVAVMAKDKYDRKLADVQELPAWAYDYLRARPKQVEDIVLEHLYRKLGWKDIDPCLGKYITVFSSKREVVSEMGVYVTIIHPFHPVGCSTLFQKGGFNSGPWMGCRELPRDSVTIAGKTYYSGESRGTDCEWLRSHFREVVRTVYPR